MVNGNKLGLGKKLILVAAGLASLVTLEGCGGVWAQIEKNANEYQAWLRAEEDKKSQEKNANEYNNPQPANVNAKQEQTNNEDDHSGEWVWDVYKGIFIRAGSNILTHEYVQNDTK
jgi:phenylalanyl-tRNA synthetase alpha subunit